MAKTKRSELEDQIVTICKESELQASDQFAAIARARQRLQKGYAPAPQKKSYKALTRPGGGIMGKQKRAAKEE